MTDPFLVYIDRLKTIRLGNGETQAINMYKEMPPALRLAMHFIPGAGVNDLPKESRFEIEEIQLHAMSRLNPQSRGDLVRRAEAALARIADGYSVSYVISNGSDDRWRYWRTDPLSTEEQWYSGPDWTADVNKACHFARREDAETWAHDDEDAWFIRRRIILAGDGKLEELQTTQQAVDLDIAARTEAAAKLCMQAQRVAQAPPNIWAVGDLLPLIRDMAAFISFFAPDAKPAGQLAPSSEGQVSEEPPPPTFCLPVDKRSAAEVLLLYRAFILRNVTQWAMGAGDHHHPIWEHVAVNVEGIEPTSGPEWQYIQPENRQPLVVLEELARQKEYDTAGND